MSALLVLEPLSSAFFPCHLVKTAEYLISSYSNYTTVIKGDISAANDRHARTVSTGPL